MTSGGDATRTESDGANGAPLGMRLRAGLAIIAMDGGVQIRGGDEEIFVLQTDAPRTVEAIVRGLGRGDDPAAIRAELGGEHVELVDAVLQQLAQEGLLVDRAAEPDDDIARYLSHFPSARGHDDRTDRFRASVCIIGHQAVADLLAQALGEHGIAVCRQELAVLASAAKGDGSRALEPGQVVACIWEHPDPPLVVQVNEMVCGQAAQCLFVDLSHGCHATLGPFYVPGEGACYACYRERWRQNTAALVEADAAWAAQLERHAAPVPHGTLPAFRYQLAGLASAEIFAFLSWHRPLRTLNRAVTVDFEALRMWSEPVWRIPWCPSCGACE